MDVGTPAGGVGHSAWSYRLYGVLVHKSNSSGCVAVSSMSKNVSRITQMRLTHTEAEKIINTPPTVLEHYFMDDKKHGTRWEMQKIVGSGGLPERWRSRRHTIFGVSEWEHAG